MENINKFNVFTGKHTILCTLESWAEFGWMIKSNMMEDIKNYMPIVSHACNMVSNYSNESIKKDIVNIISKMIQDEELIHDKTFTYDDNIYLDVFIIPELENHTYVKQHYLLMISIKDITIFIWRKPRF